MIAAFRMWWFRRWSAEQQRRYAARRALHRPKYLRWLAERVLPGSPKTVHPGGGVADES